MVGRAIRYCRWLAVLAFVPVVGVSQEGFPLDGTWRGTWGDGGSESNAVVIVMKWDGESINGRINPGPNSISFTSAGLDPADWGVHIEAQTADGETIRIDGTLTDIGLYNRRVEGRWRQGSVDYDFSITRE